MKAVLKKDLRISFARPELYAFMAVTLLAAGIAAWINHALTGYPNFELSMPYGLYALIGAAPLLTMGTWRDERRQNTHRLLGALPLRAGGIVLGKFLALLVPLAIVTALLMAYALIPLALGATAFLAAWGYIVCFFTFGILALGLGLFQSALSRCRWDAFLTTAALLALAIFGPQLSAWLLAMKQVPLYILMVGLLVALLTWAFSHQVNAALVGLVVGAGLSLALIFLGQVTLLNSAVSGLLALLSRSRTLAAAANGLVHLSASVVNLAIGAMFLVWTAGLLGLKLRGKEGKAYEA